VHWHLNCNPLYVVYSLLHHFARLLHLGLGDCLELVPDCFNLFVSGLWLLDRACALLVHVYDNCLHLISGDRSVSRNIVALESKHLSRWRKLGRIIPLGWYRSSVRTALDWLTSTALGGHGEGIAAGVGGFGHGAATTLRLLSELLHRWLHLFLLAVAGRRKDRCVATGLIQ